LKTFVFTNGISFQLISQSHSESEKDCAVKSPLRGTENGGGDFETYSWGHSGSNAQLHE